MPALPPRQASSLGHEHCSSVWSHARRQSSGWDVCLPSGRIRIWPCVLIALHVSCVKYFQSRPLAILCGVWQQRLQSKARATWLHDALFLPEFQLRAAEQHEQEQEWQLRNKTGLDPAVSSRRADSVSTQCCLDFPRRPILCSEQDQNLWLFFTGT